MGSGKRTRSPVAEFANCFGIVSKRGTMNRSFLMLLILVIFLGAGFGGSFVGGVIYGQSIQEEEETVLSPRLGAAGQFQGGGQGAASGQGRRGQPGAAAITQASGANSPAVEGAVERQTDGQGSQGNRQRDRAGQAVQSESPTAEAATETGAGTDAAPPANPSATGEGQRAGAGRGGIVGTVQGLEGDLLTVASPLGEQSVTLSDTTTFYQVSEVSRETLAPESRVRVAGSVNPDGSISAQSVVIVPEGVDDLFGAAGGPGGRRRGEQP